MTINYTFQKQTKQFLLETWICFVIQYETQVRERESKQQIFKGYLSYKTIFYHKVVLDV